MEHVTVRLLRAFTMGRNKDGGREKGRKEEVGEQEKDEACLHLT